jgi:hypothetical protein
MAVLSESLSLRLKPGRARASQAHSFPWAEPITARGEKDYEPVKMVRSDSANASCEAVFLGDL